MKKVRKHTLVSFQRRSKLHESTRNRTITIPCMYNQLIMSIMSTRCAGLCLINLINLGVKISNFMHVGPIILVVFILPVVKSDMTGT
jgi:hypothetical protein